MSPTVRLDDEVYRALQERAEPFVDTPNSVLRRLLNLGEPTGSTPDDAFDANEAAPELKAVPRPSSKSGTRKRRSKKRKRAPTGTLLREEEYEIPLLAVLDEQGGSAPAGEVLRLLGERLEGKLMENDYKTLSSGGIRWENRAQFVRFNLVQKGDMADDSPRGVWAISEQGRRRLAEESRS